MHLLDFSQSINVNKLYHEVQIVFVVKLMLEGNEQGTNTILAHPTHPQNPCLKCQLWYMTLK